MKTTLEILLEVIPSNCIWENNLDNTPIEYIVTAMEKHLNVKLEEIEHKIANLHIDAYSQPSANTFSHGVESAMEAIKSVKI